MISEKIWTQLKLMNNQNDTQNQEVMNSTDQNSVGKL